MASIVQFRPLPWRFLVVIISHHCSHPEDYCGTNKINCGYLFLNTGYTCLLIMKWISAHHLTSYIKAILQIILNRLRFRYEIIARVVCNITFWLLFKSQSRWRHQMETFSALHSPVTGEFPAQRPVTRSFDVFFDLCKNERLNKQGWGWWFETPSGPLWRHCSVLYAVLPSDCYLRANISDNLSLIPINQKCGHSMEHHANFRNPLKTRLVHGRTSCDVWQLPQWDLNIMADI